MNKSYVRPTLRVQGKLEVMTQGSSTGTVIDMTFQTGTPVSSLTFS